MGKAAPKRLRHVLVAFVISQAVFTAGAQADEQYDKIAQPLLRQLQTQLNATRDPISEQMLKESIASINRNEAAVRERVEGERWELFDTQYVSANGQQRKPKTIDIVEAPPRSLKPGQLFTIKARTRGVQPNITFKMASGSHYYAERRLQSSRHLNSNGKPVSTSSSYDKEILGDSEQGYSSLVTHRTRLPLNQRAYYLRYIVTDRNLGNRIAFVYKYNASLIAKTKLTVLDANPLFNSSKLPTELLPTELIQARTVRKGTSADGVSQLILRAELSSASKVIFTLADQADGNLVPLLGGRTIKLKEKHYAFALYTPPQSFGGGSVTTTPKSLFHPDAQPKYRLESVLEYRPVKIQAQTESDPVGESVEIQLARPPVVMVHGLLSNPYECWVKTKSTGTSMTVLLEKAGLLPFLVNYQTSNGTPVTAAANSRFADNANAVWDRADQYVNQPYQEGWVTNPYDESWLTDFKEEPIFSEHQRAGPKRLGGIKHALQYYRDRLNLAATQADVVGHSMGGILARVYAAKPDYRRSENYGQGDIHRLITLNTPHHGSELSHVYDALTQGWIDDESWTNWATRVVPRMGGFFIGVKTPAVIDLTAPLTVGDIPNSALGQIGETQVPSFAIATHASHEFMRTDTYDEHLIYHKAFGTVGMAFFYNRALLNNFIRLRAEQWQSAPDDVRVYGSSVGKPPVLDFNAENALDHYAELISSNIDASVYYWERRRSADYVKASIDRLNRLSVYPFGSIDNDRSVDDPKTLISSATKGVSKLIIGGDVTKLARPDGVQDAPSEVIAMIRDLIFHNDHQNDGAVRVVSQLGGLPDEHSETYQGVLHSFSPWHYQVQRKVIELLKWEDAKFSKKGFPTAGQITKRYLPSQQFAKARVHGEHAIRWAGIVPSHAEVYAELADQQKAVILVRPVNRDATKLIADDNATKAMAVKGKSSNWGPQTGFIPEKQRFSKLWRVYQSDPAIRTAQINKYDKITEAMIDETHPDDPQRTYVVKRSLIKNIDEVDYQILTDPNEPDAEKAIYLFDSASGQYRDIDMRKREVDAVLAKTLAENPMVVLADGMSQREPPPYVTADYDLLAIGFHNDQAFEHGEPKEVTEASFDSLMGYVSPKQKNLIKQLNDDVFHKAGYQGGKVTHHGPEVQYPGSPYVDYPILVADPGEPDVKNDQSVFIIRQGPPGFRDIHLKRYFAEQINKGYQLWPNPKSQGWLWKYTEGLGYDPRDNPNLLPYVDEQSDPDLDDINVGSAEPEMAFRHQLAQAKLGEQSAQQQLADYYRRGHGTAKDSYLGQFWSDLSKDGNASASFAAGSELDTRKKIETSIAPQSSRSISVIKDLVPSPRSDAMVARQAMTENLVLFLRQSIKQSDKDAFLNDTTGEAKAKYEKLLQKSSLQSLVSAGQLPRAYNRKCSVCDDEAERCLVLADQLEWAQDIQPNKPYAVFELVPRGFFSISIGAGRLQRNYSISEFVFGNAEIVPNSLRNDARCGLQ